MEGIGFNGRGRPEEFSTGRWILGFVVGDVVWWLAWMTVISRLGYTDLFGATFVGASILGTSLYTPGIRLLATVIDWIPFVLTASIAYRLKFGDRSGWPFLIWIGAAYVIGAVTRFVTVFFLAFG